MVWSLVTDYWCCRRVLLQGAAVSVLFALWSLVADAGGGGGGGGAAAAAAAAAVELQSAGAGCRCKVLLSECCLCFGAWLLMPLQGPCKVLILELGCGCHCKVPPQGAAVRVMFVLWNLVLFVLWSLVVSAAACCCAAPRVLFAL